MAKNDLLHFFEILSCHFFHFFLICFMALVFYCLEKSVVQHVITFNLFPGAISYFSITLLKGVIHFFSKPAIGFVPEHIEIPK